MPPLRMALLVGALVVVFSALSSRSESHRVAGTVSRLDPGRSITIVSDQFDPRGLRLMIGATTVFDGDRDAVVPGAFITVTYRLVGDRGRLADRLSIR